MEFTIRAKTPSVASAAVAAIHAMDPGQPVLRVGTMEQILAGSLSRQRLVMLLLAAFAGLALLLAAVGIYSVLAYGVRRRGREIGIRMALGAQPADVLRMMLLQGMRPALLGLAIGLGAALALGRVLSGLIFGVSASDPATFAAVAVLLFLVALSPASSRRAVPRGSNPCGRCGRNRSLRGFWKPSGGGRVSPLDIRQERGKTPVGILKEGR